MDSRVVMGQFLRNSLFLQAFYEGRDQDGIFGKSRLISSAYVMSMMCKTPESNKSLNWAVYLPTADKYRRLTHRLSQDQTGLYERALVASQRPSAPW